MKEIEPPDNHHLRAAIGWLELGSHLDAESELDRIQPKLQLRPDVLELRWQIRAKAHAWDECLRIAEDLVGVAPDDVVGYIHRSFALHELKRTQEAFDLLRPVLEKFPDDPVIPYNLACYRCQLGWLDDAVQLLTQCYSRARNKGDWKKRALEDPDLRPLWSATA